MTGICTHCWDRATHGHTTDLDLYRHEHANHEAEPCS